jgi:hypothetical protein
VHALGDVAGQRKEGLTMLLEDLISTISKTPRRQRARVLHEVAIAALARLPALRLRAVQAAFAGHSASSAFANLAWEASFER